MSIRVCILSKMMHSNAFFHRRRPKSHAMLFKIRASGLDSLYCISLRIIVVSQLSVGLKALPTSASELRLVTASEPTPEQIYQPRRSFACCAATRVLWIFCENKVEKICTRFSGGPLSMISLTFVDKPIDINCFNEGTRLRVT